jgi:hypothetical protein
MAEKLRMHSYMECSAKTQQGVPELLEHAIRVGLEYKAQKASESAKVSQHKQETAPSRHTGKTEPNRRKSNKVKGCTIM